jgi:hypothetical protein
MDHCQFFLLYLLPLGDFVSLAKNQKKTLDPELRKRKQIKICWEFDYFFLYLSSGEDERNLIFI